MDKNKKLIINSIIFFVFFIIAFALYYKILSFTFYQDDFVWLSISKDIISGKIGIWSLKISNFFMPTIYSYFTFAWLLFQSNPIYYYLFNIILHTINAFLLFILLKNFFKEKTAILLGLIFLTLRYPMEATVWISAVTVLITTFFILLTSLSWINYLKTNNNKYYIISIIFIILSILTKEWSVLILPFLILLSILYNQNINLKTLTKQLLPIGIIIVIYLVIEFFLQKNQSPLIAHGFYKIGLHAIPNILNNILLTFAPLTKMAQTKNIIWTSLSTIFFITNIIIGIIMWKKYNNKLIIGIFWMMIAFLPTSFFTWDPYISRYAYLPAIGAIIYLGYLFNFFEDIKYWKTISFIGFVIYIFINAVFLYRTNINFYSPTHEENKKFIIALQDVESKINKQKDLIIYNNTPVTGFILPDLLYSLFNIEKNKIKVYPNDKVCPIENQCLKWNSNKKIIELNA